MQGVCVADLNAMSAIRLLTRRPRLFQIQLSSSCLYLYISQEFSFFAPLFLIAYKSTITGPREMLYEEERSPRATISLLSRDLLAIQKDSLSWGLKSLNNPQEITHLYEVLYISYSINHSTRETPHLSPSSLNEMISFQLPH